MDGQVRGETGGRLQLLSRVKGWIRLPLDSFFMPPQKGQQDAPETPVIVESKSEVDGLTDLSISNPVVNSRPLPDPWGDDWNDSLANMRLWLDEDEDHM